MTEHRTLTPGETISGPGVFQMESGVYHADPSSQPSLSSTLARLIIDRSPLHAWTAHPRLNPAFEPIDKKTFDIGRAAHRAVLGAGGDYLAYPEELLAANGAASTKAAKEWADAARASGLTPLKASEVDTIGAIADSVRRRLEDMRIEIDPAHSELSAFAEIDGTSVRAMIDYAPEGKPWLLDIKTTTDASPDGCIRAVTNYGYDVQAAFYLDCWRAATGEDRKFRFLMVEKEPPFECSMVELFSKAGDEADWMADAHGKARYAREVWRDCMATDQWPGYPAQIAVIGAPGFYRHKWESFGAEERPPRPSAEAIRAAREFQAPERMKQ